MCTIKILSQQLSTDPKTLIEETKRDASLQSVIQYTQHVWPTELSSDVKPYFKLKESLSVSCDVLFYGPRVIIPTSLRKEVLHILHLGHFGMQRMKQLARSAVYWPGIDSDIEETARSCDACNEHQRLPPKETYHPWMTPTKPWSRIHIDHAVNFKGANWLVLVDAKTKFPCIHRMTSITTKSTTQKLDECFAFLVILMLLNRQRNMLFFW